MTDILPSPPTDELIAEYNRRIRQLDAEAHEDVERRREQHKQWERERFRRYEDEVRGLIRMRDALANILTACQYPAMPFP